MQALGELEDAITCELWRRDEPVTVREVSRAVSSSRDLACTTVMTVLDRLHGEAELAREEMGCAWHHRPVRTETDHLARLTFSISDDSDGRQAVLERFPARLDVDGVARVRVAVAASPYREEPSGAGAT